MLKSHPVRPAYFSVTETAQVFRVRPETVMAWCRSGLIEARKIGGKWFISRSAVILPSEGGKRW